MNNIGLVVLIAAGIILLCILVGLLVVWLFSRGKSVPLGGIVKNQDGVKEPRAEFKLEGNSSSNDPSDTPDFFGREKELAWLRDLFDEVAEVDHKTGKSKAGPKLAVIVAETGIGKSRLVQELYQQLTKDENWDPDKFNYWPDVFQNISSDKKFVNPVFDNHTLPTGPPLFMWLGMNWDSTPEPLGQQDCKLPDANNLIIDHIKRAKEQETVWQALCDNLKEEISNASLVELGMKGIEYVDLIPLFDLCKDTSNLAIKSIKQIKTKTKIGDESLSLNNSASVKLLKNLKRLMSSKSPMPVILWLDDAHWIDKLSLEFLNELLIEANCEKWPLFVIATHWEREWNQGLADDSLIIKSLAHFNKREYTCCRTLANASDKDLRTYINDKLPGLTRVQKVLLVKKAGGNFSTITENVGQLLNSESNFINSDNKKQLTDVSMRKIQQWKSKRDARIAQRFDELEESVRNILGWSSHIGQRFISEVVENYARNEKVEDPKDLISKCVEQNALLAQVGSVCHEFRDYGYFKVAFEHFAYDEVELNKLLDVLRAHLAEWINNSFDAEGSLLAGPYDDAETIKELGIKHAPERSIKYLESSSRTDMLDLATRKLELPVENPDWNNLLHIAAIRSYCWSVGENFTDGTFEKCRDVGRRLQGVDWLSLPTSILSVEYRSSKSSQFDEIGLRDISISLMLSVLDHNNNQYDAVSTSENKEEVALAHFRLGELFKTEGKIQKAREHYLKALELVEQVAKEDPKPANLHVLSTTYDTCGAFEKNQHKYEDARKHFMDALALDQRLAKDGGYAEKRYLAIALRRLAEFEHSVNKNVEAKKRYEESLLQYKSIMEEYKSHISILDYANALTAFAGFYTDAEDSGKAREHYLKALELIDQVAKEDPKPANLHVLSTIYDRCGEFEKGQHKYKAARKHFIDALAIDQRLAKEIGGYEDKRYLAFALIQLAEFEHSVNKNVEAKKRYEEALFQYKSIMEEYKSHKSILGYASALSKFAGFCTDAGDSEKAREHYIKALELYEQVAKEDPKPDNLALLSLIYDRCGEFEKGQHKYKAARKHFIDALAIDQRLAKEIGGYEDKRYLAFALIQLAEFEHSVNKNVEAKKRYEEALFQYKSIMEEYKSHKSILGYASALSKFAGFCTDAGDSEKAREHYIKALELYEQVAKEDPKPDNLALLSSIYDRCGEFEKGQHKYKAARKHFIDALAIDQRRAKEIGGYDEKRCLAIALERLAEFEQSVNKNVEAKKRYEEALLQYKSIMEEYKSHKSILLYAETLSKFAGFCTDAGDSEKAREHYLKALELYEQVAKEDPKPDNLALLSSIYDRCGEFEKGQHKYKAARKHFMDALALDQRLAKEIGGYEDKRWLAIALRRLAEFEHSVNKNVEAKKRYEESLLQYKSIMEEYKSQKSILVYAYALTAFAGFYTDAEDSGKAREHYLKALELVDQVAKEDPKPANLFTSLVYLALYGAFEKGQRKDDTARKLREKALDLRTRITAKIDVSIVDSWEKRLNENYGLAMADAYKSFMGEPQKGEENE